MPSRLLREGILDSEPVNSLSWPAEVFYRRLMSVVDDFGRFDGRPAVLRSRLYPLKTDRVREADIARWSAECATAGLIALYAVDGKQYVLFRKLGSPRAKESRYPSPPDGSAHLQTDENGCLQTHTDAPYSDSYSGSSSKDPPNPPEGGKKKRPAKKAEPHPAFAGFWSAYPRHEAKERAAAAFAKLDPSPELLTTILAAVEAQKRPGGALELRTAANGQCVVPHAASWLNGRRWEDEPPKAQPPPDLADRARQTKENLERLKATNAPPMGVQNGRPENTGS